MIRVLKEIHDYDDEVELLRNNFGELISRIEIYDKGMLIVLADNMVANLEFERLKDYIGDFIVVADGGKIKLFRPKTL